PAYGTASSTPYVATFRISDGRLTATISVNITVTHTNRPPSLQVLGEQRVAEEHTLTLTLVGTDPDGDPLTYAALNLPAGAIFDFETHTYRWTPAFGQAGEYRVLFKVTDGELWDSKEGRIIVTKGKLPPVIDPQGPFTVKEGAPVDFNITASDPQG